MKNVKVDPKIARKVSCTHQRSLGYYVALVLASALLFSSPAILMLNEASAYRPDFRVTEASLTADNSNMSGPCPARVVFHGYITTNGPGTVRYTFTRSDGATAPPQEIYFQQAGRQAVSTDWTLGGASALRFEAWRAIRILSPNSLESNRANFTLDCRQQSVPPNPHGRFRVTLNGFTVNHQTNQGLWASWDAVRFPLNTAEVDATGQLRLFQWSDSSLDLRGTIGSSPENEVQGGSASTRGGLQTGDGFPTQTTPWRRREDPDLNARTPPMIYFEGQITQNTNAAVIIPSIWVEDRQRRLLSSNLHLDGAYFSQLIHDRPALGRAVARIIRGPQPLRLDSYLRAGASMGLNNGIRLAIGVPQDRPIGMQPERDQFGFIPQVLVLTLDSAEFLSHTDFGVGIGVVPVRYVDPQGFAGDYTLYLQVERLGN